MTRSLPPIRALFAAATLLAAQPGFAATPREMLVTAALNTTDKVQALALVSEALTETQNELAADPNNKEAQLQHAVAIGDRAKLNKSPGDAKEARRLFGAFASSNPRDPEGQFAIASWHLDTVAAGLFATTVLGAKKDVGLTALNRAVALANGRPFITGYAALLHIRADPGDIATARQWAETAAAAPTSTNLDRYAQRAAQAVLIPLRSGDGRAAANLARTLLPFGRLK